jgi:hypothetical protein
MSNIPILLILFCFSLGCEQSEFAGRTAKQGSSNQEPATPGEDGIDSGQDDDDNKGDDDQDGKLDEGGNGNGDDDDDNGIDVEDDSVWKPLQCNGSNGKIVVNAMCPDHHAGFISDDGNNARVGCCPLPSRNILDKDSDPVARGTCGANEIAVGASGAGFFCQKINMKKYSLSAPQTVCYRGNGAAGGNGVSQCANINAALQGLITLTNDRDGCTAQPYGAIMVSKNGKDCRDQKSAEVIDKATGQPVKMFP